MQLLRFISPIFFILSFTSPLLQSTQIDPRDLYISASVTPYFWDDAGEAWLLLGKEKRGTGVFWFNNGGKRDKGEKDSEGTAKREGGEENAYSIEYADDPKPIPFYMSVNPPFWIRTDVPPVKHHVAYFMRVKEKTDPKAISAAADALGAGAHVEKFQWQWVKAQDFLEQIQKGDRYNLLDAPIYSVFAQTMREPAIVSYIQKNIIEQGKERAKKKGTSAAAAPAITSLCVIPYSWNKGKTWILLGLERGTPPTWSFFCGRAGGRGFDTKVAGEILATKTASKVMLRELGRHPVQLQLKENMTYILPAMYIDTKDIDAAAQRLRDEARKKQEESGVVKVDWKWVNAEDLLRGVVEWESHQPRNPTYRLSDPTQQTLKNPDVIRELLGKIEQGKKF